MKKIFVCLGIVLCLVASSVFAATKEDVLNFVNAQSVCDDGTSSIFNSYKTTFSRLLRQKELSSSDLDRVMNYLQNSVGILNSKGVCKISDLGKLSSSERSTVYNNLTSGANIIVSAPLVGESTNNVPVTNPSENESENGNTNTNTNTNTPASTTPADTRIVLNTAENVVEIYTAGKLVDKVDVNQERLTYTGPNKSITTVIVVSLFILIVSIGIYLFNISKHSAKLRCLKNIFMSLIICSAFIAVICIVFTEKIDTLLNSLSLIKFKDVGNASVSEEVLVDENNNIKRYPAYGDKYAKLSIPSVNISTDIAFGDSAEILSDSVGHATWSLLPTERGNIVLSGHNKEKMLRNLKDVAQDDKIRIETNYATCTYNIYKMDIIKDTELSKLQQTSNTETLIVYTCYPFSNYIYGDERFVVYATLENIDWK